MGFIDIRVNGKSIVLDQPKMQLLLRGFALDDEIVLGSYTLPMEAPVCYENEQIFGHQYLLESVTNKIEYTNADLILGGVLQSRGFIRLLNANSKRYRFSFIYKPLNNIFFNRSLRSVGWDNSKFWKGGPVPATYDDYMDFLEDVAINADAYIPGGVDTFCLAAVRCPNWNELPEGVISSSDWENSFDGRRRLNLFNAAAGLLVRNYFNYYQENTDGGTSLDYDFTYTTEPWNEQKICPFVYSAFILEELWRLSGWKVSGSLFEHEDFLRDIQINSFALDRFEPFAAMRLKWDHTDFAVSDKLPLINDYAFKPWYNDATKEFNIPTSVLTVSGPIPSVMCCFWINLIFEADVTGSTVEVGIYNTGYHYTASGVGVGNTVTISLITIDDGGPYRGIFTNYDFSLRVVSTDIPLAYQTLTDAGVWMWLTDTDGNYYHTNILDNRVEYKNHLPDITVGDFIKSILKRFGSEQHYDFTTKTVYYNVLKETLKTESQTDITDIVIERSYDKEIKSYYTESKYTGNDEFNFDTSTFEFGFKENYTEKFLNEITGCPLESKFQGNYKVPYFGTKGASTQLQREFNEGMIYLHYKGMQPGSDGLYPAPYASANNLLNDGSEFSSYNLELSYIIPYYWAAYFSAKSNPVTFQLVMNLALLSTMDMFKLLRSNYQKYFIEEMVVHIDDVGIKETEIKLYQL